MDIENNRSDKKGSDEGVCLGIYDSLWSGLYSFRGCNKFGFFKMLIHATDKPYTVLYEFINELHPPIGHAKWNNRRWIRFILDHDVGDEFFDLFMWAMMNHMFHKSK